jgi:integrase
MASVFKSTYLMPIPEDATRTVVRGVRCVRYTDGKGKTRVRPVKLDDAGNETGKMLCEQRTWWMKYTVPGGAIRREKGFTDKLASEQEAARREREAQQASAGLTLVNTAHLSSPIKDHFAAFISALELRGRSPEYYDRLEARLHTTAEECEWQSLRQVNLDDMTHFMMKLKQDGKSGKTINEFLAGFKGFLNWCVQTRRLAANPLAAAAKIDNVEKTFHRRAMTPEEAERFLAAAGKRRLVYLTAIYTGLRRKELRLLEWGDLHLDPSEGKPHITLRAKTTKARRADVLPLRAEVADELRQAKPEDALPTDRVFKTMPNRDTFRSDLERAEVKHKDASGRKLDLHALRYTYGTWLAKSGVAPRVAMELMRHTDIRLTTNLYTDPTLLNVAGAIEGMPTLKDKREEEALKATGTDNASAEKVEKTHIKSRLPIALIRGKDRPRGTLLGQKMDTEVSKMPRNSHIYGGGHGPASETVSSFNRSLHIMFMRSKSMCPKPEQVRFPNGVGSVVCKRLLVNDSVPSLDPTRLTHALLQPAAAQKNYHLQPISFLAAHS